MPEHSDDLRRARFLADAGFELASLLDFNAVTSRVSSLAVPILGDSCFVDVLLDSGEIERAASPRTNGNEDARASETDDPRYVLRIPLEARGRTLGTVTFVSADPTRVYDARDRELAQGLADRAALAMDTAKLFRAREEMMAVVSHDLRNPLNVITVGLASLKRGVSEERRTLFLDKIKRAADRMNGLIEDLLDVTRLETGALAIEREEHVPIPIAIEALESLRPLADEKGVALILDAAPLGDRPVLVDRDRLLQILGNLVGNAIKFTPAGGSVTLRGLSEDDAIRFRITDTGPGIPAAEQARIFDRYYQVRRSDRRGGSGLGLAIAKGLIEAHGGELAVESAVTTTPEKPNPGSTFDFTLKRR